MFLLVPAYPGCPGSKAVKRSLLLLLLLALDYSISDTSCLWSQLENQEWMRHVGDLPDNVRTALSSGRKNFGL